MTLASCQVKESTALVEEQSTKIEFLLRPIENKSIPGPVIGEEIDLSGTSFGYSQAQYDSLRPIGYWGGSMSKTLDVNGGIKNLKCWYKRGGVYTRFYPVITLKATNPDGTIVYHNLNHVVVKNLFISDGAGYNAEMYYEMVTEFELSFNHGGLVVNPLTNSQPFINTKVQYSGIADPNLPWPDSINVADYNELGSDVVAGEQLYIVTTYNDLRGERKLPMNYNSTNGKWEFEFPYLPSAGMNFRIEKATTQALFMGVKLSTSLGEVSCSNIHYFPNSSGQNTWLMFEASLVNGAPTIPWPNINQLINILELIINPTSKNIPVIPNPELQNPELQIIIPKKI